MADTSAEFARVFLVYCIHRLPDGGYIALNRRYKPLGVADPAWVEYETAPGRFKFKRALSEAQIVALSCRGDAGAERIYLYHDGAVPTDNEASWRDYSARLQRLAGLKVVLG